MLRRTVLAASTGVLVALTMAPLQVRAEPATLNYSWPSNVGPLNPHLYSPSQMFAQGMVYEGLVRYVEGGGLEPLLATSWTISEDGKVYTFTLRDGVTFSDGTPFDATAVKANLDSVLMNRDRHSWLELVTQLQRVEVVDSKTVRLVLANAYYPTLQELALIRPVRFISPKAMPASGNTAEGIAAPIGTGPWKLVDSVRGERDVFARNESYWGMKPAFERIVVKVVPDPMTRALAFESGEIDLVYGTEQLSSEAYRRLAADPRFAAAISPPLASRVLAINSKSGPTADLAVRRAIQHGIDRTAIVKNVLLDIERPADTLFATNFPYTDVKLEPFGFDRERAARLLDESGWKAGADGTRSKNGQALAIDLAFTGTDALQKAIAEAVQGDLAKLGFAVRLLGEDEANFYARQHSGDFGMIFGDTWGAPYDPPSFMSSMRAPSHADYQAQLGLPMKAEIDRKIQEVLLSTEESKRRELYDWLLSTLHEQAVYFPVSYTTAVSVHSPKVESVSFGPTVYEVPFARMRPGTGG